MRRLVSFTQRLMFKQRGVFKQHYGPAPRLSQHAS